MMVFTSPQGKLLQDLLQQELTKVGIALELSERETLEQAPTSKGVLPEHAEQLRGWLLRVIRDEALRDILIGIVHCPQHDFTAYVLDLNQATDRELASLAQDIRTFRDLHVERVERQLDQEHHSLIPFFEDWKQLTRHLRQAARSGNGLGHIRIDLDQLNQEWQKQPSEQQTLLVPLVQEYTQLIAVTFPLPAWFRERAEPYLRQPLS